MAAKIFALLALVALSVSAANALLTPQCSPSPIASIILPYLQPFNALGFEHPIVQSFRLQQTLAASILLPSSSVILQRPWALQQQQYLAHQAVQSVAAVQQQQLLHAFSQVAVANPAAYRQQQQILPFSQLAVANPAAAYLQQQQLLSFNQLALANTSPYWQQQQLNTLAVANAAAALVQQQQLLPFNQLAAMNPAIIFQQPIVRGAIF